MTQAQTRDRLLAILAADAVGYSRLMALDDAGTVVALDAARAVFRRHIEAHGGRVIDMAGDAVLAVFETATAAVKSALAIQVEASAALADLPEDRRLRHRIGVHVGDVLEKPDGSVYGSGVNIAARLESLAPPGGVAVSGAVHEMVRSRVAATFQDIGPQQVKNISEPVRAFVVLPAGEVPASGKAGVNNPVPGRRPGARAWLAGITVAGVLIAGLIVWQVWPVRADAPVAARSGTVVTDNPLSIAVLAFGNTSDDKANEAFAEGLSEELLGLLGRIQSLRVTARSSSFSFKGKQLPLPEVARQLGVTYLVDGTVRRAGERVRIGVELVRGSDGVTMWRDSFDREVKDALAVQAEVAVHLARRLNLQLAAADFKGSGTRNPEAFQIYLAARAETDPAIRQAKYRKVLELDPGFARARVQMLGDRYFQFHRQGKGAAGDDELRALVQEVRSGVAEALRSDPKLSLAYSMLARTDAADYDQQGWAQNADRALALDPSDPIALDSRAELQLLRGDIEGSLGFRRQLVAVSPFGVPAHLLLAEQYVDAGQPESALSIAERTLLLDANSGRAVGAKAAALLQLGRRDEALTSARRALVLGDFVNAPVVLWQLGHAADHEAVRRMKLDSPHLRARMALVQEQTAPMLAFVEHDRMPTDVANRALFDPLYDPLRNEPRFLAWLQKTGLVEAHARAQAWRAAHPVPTAGR